MQPKKLKTTKNTCKSRETQIDPFPHTADRFVKLGQLWSSNIQNGKINFIHFFLAFLKQIFMIWDVERDAQRKMAKKHAISYDLAPASIIKSAKKPRTKTIKATECKRDANLNADLELTFDDDFRLYNELRNRPKLPF